MTFDSKIVSREISALLWRNHKTLSTAESCTAGRISSVITSIPGSSNYFKGGLVCYWTDLKESFLHVDPETICRETVVSENVVRQMVVGANSMFQTDYAIAISGYAGPGGDSTNSGTSVPVGTIWIAVGREGNIRTVKLDEDKGRERNLEYATVCAVRLLRDYLVDELGEIVAE
ncbi:MAG: CinA family protein [Alloprevotella sp.]|nr:CinA family protein [Alloprevotella sp.]